MMLIVDDKLKSYFFRKKKEEEAKGKIEKVGTYAFKHSLIPLMRSLAATISLPSTSIG